MWEKIGSLNTTDDQQGSKTAIINIVGFGSFQNFTNDFTNIQLYVSAYGGTHKEVLSGTKRYLKVGYVINGKFCEYWVGSSTQWISAGYIEIASYNSFNISLNTASAEPTGFVEITA